MLYNKKDAARAKAANQNLAPGRSEFRRDYGRLLHSPAFRRLQGKTQLFPGAESDFFRNRLTHSLEVAQVAKGIALQINSEPPFLNDPIDTDLVELACLAHDLGHPPFGHNGEKALDDCMKPYGGFEGNAQTLRLLSRIEKKVRAADADESDTCGISKDGADLRLGLNLTYRSLAAVLKYDRKIPRKRKAAADLVKGYYASESDLVNAIKLHVGVPSRGRQFKTIECQIMDLADDIAYSTYDLEDSLKGGFSHPLAVRARLARDSEFFAKIYEKVAEKVERVGRSEVFAALFGLFDLGSALENGGQEEGPLVAFNQSMLVAGDGRLRAGFTSKLVDKFISGIRIMPARKLKFSKISLARETHIEIESLKYLNYISMIMSPRLKVVEYRGYDLVATIFKTLSMGEGYLLLPEDYREMYSRLRKREERMRLICDFIAGMTDRYAVEFYGRLKEAGASIFKPL